MKSFRRGVSPLVIHKNTVGRMKIHIFKLILVRKRRSTISLPSLRTKLKYRCNHQPCPFTRQLFSVRGHQAYLTVRATWRGITTVERQCQWLCIVHRTINRSLTRLFFRKKFLNKSIGNYRTGESKVDCQLPDTFFCRCSKNIEINFKWYTK